MSKLPLVASIYNPQNQNREQLINSFVVRLNTFKKLFHEIEGAEMKFPEQHYLIVGKRGMGKTTLLLRLSYEIENTPKLNNWLIPLVFNEEEYSIWKLYKFWIRVAELLEDKEENYFYGLSQEIEDLWDEYDNDEDYEKAIFEIIANKLKTQKKKIILFIDNVGDMFNKFSDHDAHRLRKILQTSADIRLFAASSKMTESFFKYEHPFYEFFKIEYLKGLNQKETEDLLLQLGETYQQKEKIEDIIKNQKGRVESLRRLTGGVIRTIVLLFEIFVDSKNGSAFSDLEAILDRVTPLYKHRMDDLPKQQQEIVEAIALAWDAMNVKEIKQKTRMESKFISAQLTQLIKNDIVNRIPTSTKNHLYQISERFFNIWYLMRNGKKGDKKKVIWLIRFLEEWCDEKEIVERANMHMTKLKSNNYDERGAYYLSEAIASNKHLPKEVQHELLMSTRQFLHHKKSDFIKYLSKSDVDLFEESNNLIEDNNYKKALPLLLSMKEEEAMSIATCYHHLGNVKKAEEYYKKDIEKDNFDALNNIGTLYHEELKDFKKAEKYYLMAIDKGQVEAMFNIAILYKNEFKDFVKAEQFYLQAIDKGDIEAMFNIAHLYENEFKDFVKAEQFYLQAIDKGDIEAMFNIAHLYENEFKDFVKAEQFYLKAIDKGNVDAMYNIAFLYHNEFKDFEKAEHFYLRAIDKGNIEALNNIALLYENEFKDFEKAEHFYLRAIEKGDIEALYNIALLYENEFNDFEKAEQFYLQAIDKGIIDALNNIALLYVNEFKNIKKAEKFYLQAIDKGNVDALNNIGVLYKDVLKDFKKAEKFLLQAINKGDVDALFNIALLYKNELKEFEEAEQFYLKAIDKGDIEALNNIALLYVTELKEFEKAEQFFLKAIDKGDIEALHNIAILYGNEFKDFEKAEQFYLKAIDKGNNKALNGLAYFYFKLKKNYADALELAIKAVEKRENDPYFNHTLSCIYLWGNEIEKSLALTDKFLYTDELIAIESKHDWQAYLYLLMAKKQYAFLDDYFNSEKAKKLNLKDRLKPIYYALMYFLQDKYPNEYLRMGDELKETVEEIIAEVERLREEYQ